MNLLRDAKTVPGNEQPQVRTVRHIIHSLWLYSSLVMLVTVFSWTRYWYRPRVDIRPLFRASEQFGDLTYYFDKTSHLYRGSAELARGPVVFNYPPPAAFVDKLFLHSVPGHPVLPYLMFLLFVIAGFASVACLSVGAQRSVRVAATAAILTTAILGYPLLFTADRANLEGAAWALVGSGLCFLLGGKFRTAAVLIGCGAAIKPFPILFLLLLVRRRKYKEAALGILIPLVATLAALTILGTNPWKAYKDLKVGVASYQEDYVNNLMPVDDFRFDHSLLHGMKSIALCREMGGIRPSLALSEVPRLRAEPGGWHEARRLARVYPFIAVPALLLLLAASFRTPLLNQLTAIAIAITLFPPMAGEYTLLHLYIPFGALVLFLVRDVATGNATMRVWAMFSFLILYAFLFSPLTLFRVYSADVRLLLLLTLLVLTACIPMDSRYFGAAAADLPLGSREHAVGRQV